MLAQPQGKSFSILPTLDRVLLARKDQNHWKTKPSSIFLLCSSPGLFPPTEHTHWPGLDWKTSLRNKWRDKSYQNRNNWGQNNLLLERMGSSKLQKALICKTRDYKKENHCICKTRHVLDYQKLKKHIKFEVQLIHLHNTIILPFYSVCHVFTFQMLDEKIGTSLQTSRSYFYAQSMAA